MADRTRYCTECGQEWRKRGKLPRWCSPECTPECSVDGCTRKAQIGDVCRTHRLAVRDIPPCSIEGCSRTSWARGWCSTHYHRWRRTGSVDDPPQQSGRSIPGCDGDYVQKGFCAKHRWRLKKHGDPRWEPPPSSVGGECSVPGCERRICDKSGKGFCRPHYRSYVQWGDPMGDQKTCPVCAIRFYTNGTRREMCDKCRTIVSRHAKTMTAEELA